MSNFIREDQIEKMGANCYYINGNKIREVKTRVVTGFQLLLKKTRMAILPFALNCRVVIHKVIRMKK